MRLVERDPCPIPSLKHLLNAEYMRSSRKILVKCMHKHMFKHAYEQARSHKFSRRKMLHHGFSIHGRKGKRYHWNTDIDKSDVRLDERMKRRFEKRFKV